jgi:DNA-binding transcriptional LysR family regulator
VPDNLDIRRLRYYVAVAEELHFSRAASRLLVAQQALSRDVRHLEDVIGVRLLDRTTRRVVLTPAGSALLVRAREIIALHDATLRELRGERTSLTVDVVGPGLTPTLVLAAARRHAPDVEFFAQYGSGSVPVEQIDVTFGRHPDPPPDLGRRHVRDEPLTVLLPEQHPLADLPEVPFAALAGTRPCSRAGDHVTPGWEHAILQLLAPFGVTAAGAHPPVRGGEELAQHVRERNAPVLTMTTQPAVPGVVQRPLVDPTPLFPWQMLWRAGTDHPGLRALHRAVDELAATWPAPRADAWLPEPERSATR